MGATHIVIDGVTVRYVEDHRHVRITIAGSLAPELVTALVEDARSKLEVLERTGYQARRLP